MIRKNALTILLSVVACTTAFAQNPPFANGTFCTQGKGYYSNNVQAAKNLQSVQTRTQIFLPVSLDPQHQETPTGGTRPAL